MDTPTLTQELTELEWRVVDMALKDGPRSMSPDGRFARFMRHVFGVSVPQKLANEKLEALRRFCVRAWYWSLIRTEDLWMLTDAGYPSSAVFHIVAHIAGRRGFAPSIQERPI
jgi:hypothetical protein